MARIKKLKEYGKTVYPATIWNAVVDPTTGMTLKQLVAELTDALNRIDASTLQGHGIVTAGELDPKNKIPVVGNDGVMEIGRYLDFHMDGSKEDYNIRLRCDTTGKYQHYLPAKTGTVALTSDIYENIPDRIGVGTTAGDENDYVEHDSLQVFKADIDNKNFPVISVAGERTDGQQCCWQLCIDPYTGALRYRYALSGSGGRFTFSAWRNIG